ncbi:hypothetical protein MRX96_035026 [Rhipicephalus microplus]
MEPSPVHHRVNPGKTPKQGGHVVPVNGECRADSNFRFTQMSRHHLFADCVAVYVRVIASLEQNGQSDRHAGKSDTTVRPIGGAVSFILLLVQHAPSLPEIRDELRGNAGTVASKWHEFLSDRRVRCYTRCHCGP